MSSSTDIYTTIISTTCLQNRYTKWYISIINKAINRTDYQLSLYRRKLTAKEQFGYTECHHILPNCFCSSKQKTDIYNLIHLTAKEHYICHLLLCEMFEGNKKYKMYSSFVMMNYGLAATQISANSYSLRRKYAALAMSFYFKGKPKTVAARKKLSEYGKERLWVTDGVISKRIRKGEDLPSGFSLGRLKNIDNETGGTLEGNKKISESIKGRYWVTDGVMNLSLKPSDPIPDNFFKGRTIKQVKTRWINNGHQQTRLIEDSELPEGWNYGMVHTHKNKFRYITNGINIRAINENEANPDGWRNGFPKGHTLNTIWVTNGSENKLIKVGDDIDGGWRKGRIVSPKELPYKRKRITNGIINKYVDPSEPLPDGYWFGSTTNNRVYKPKKWITDGIKTFMVDVDDKLSEGWMLGRLKKDPA